MKPKVSQPITDGDSRSDPVNTKQSVQCAHVGPCVGRRPKQTWAANQRVNGTVDRWVSVGRKSKVKVKVVGVELTGVRRI